MDYRATSNGVKICNSTDTNVQSSWRLRNEWLSSARLHCKGNMIPITFKSSFVLRNLRIYNFSSHQLFSINEYGISNGLPVFCEESLKPISKQLTNEDFLLCKNNIINVTFQPENFQLDSSSVIYKKRIYSLHRYTVDDGVIKICNSSDRDLLLAWKLRYDVVHFFLIIRKCRHNIVYFKRWKKDKWDLIIRSRGTYFTSFMLLKDIVFKRHGGFCLSNTRYIKTRIRLLLFVVMTSLSFSLICLLLLLIVYSLLPSLRTLPGMNIMSLSIAFVLWDIRQLNLHSRFFYTYYEDIEDPCPP